MFDVAYNQTRKFEGGYSNNKNDRGGPTIFGISSKHWPNDFATVKNLVDTGRTKEAEEYTKNFYKKNFWDASGAEKAPPEMQAPLFDAAVHHGVGAAKKMLASSSDPNQFLDQRQDYMNKIVQNDPTQAAFQKGWANRVNEQKTPVSDELTPAEMAELEALRAEFATPKTDELSPAEMAELEQLRAEIGPKAPQEKGILERAANVGAAGADAYTWGFGPKIGAVAGSAIAKPILEAGETVNNAFGGDYQAPAFKDLYLKGVDMYSTPGKEAWKDDPALAFGASVLGGLKSGKQLAKTKIGSTVGNSIRNGLFPQAKGILGKTANYATSIGQSAAAGATSGAIYGAGQAEPGQELEGGADGGYTGALLGAFARPLMSVAGGTVNTVKNVVAPFTQGGREKIVGKTLERLATDPRNLEKVVPDNIPGSQLTTGQKTGDIGLLSAERALRGEAPDKFAQSMSSQNLARNKLLDEIGGVEGDIQKLKQARDSVTAPLREQAFAGKGNVLPGEPLDKIDEILSSPTGKRDAVKSALNWARDKISGVKDPEELYAVRQDINDAMQGKFDADKPALKLAKSQLKQVKDELDKTIERGAPGFTKYLDEYRGQSKPINQKEAIQEIRAKSGLSSPDPQTGYDLISQPRFTKQIETEKERLAKLLSEDQMGGLNAIAKDLDMASASNSPLIRAPGSDTFQNLAAKNMLGDLIGQSMASNPLTGTAMRPLSFAYKLPEERIKEHLIDALLNQQMAQKAYSRVKAPPSPVFKNRWLESAMISGQLSNK